MNQKLLLLLFLWGYMSYGQDKTVRFTNDNTAYWNKKGVFDNRESVNEIILNSDHTFEFHSFPDTSCFTWRDQKGSWERKGDSIYFYDQYTVEERDIRCEFKNDRKAQEYVLNFRTDKGSVLHNKEVSVEYVFDYDAGVKDIEQIMTIDENNQITIPFKDIANKSKLASFQIEYLLTPSEKRYGSISETNYVNKKIKDLPNIIDVEIVEKPEVQIIYRTTIGIFKGDQLQIISKYKTKTELPDFTGEINFEESYLKESVE